MMIMTNTMESCMTAERICEAYMISAVRSPPVTSAALFPSATAFPVRMPASKKMSRNESQIQNCIAGPLIAMMRSARVKSLRTSSEEASNFFFSKSSRTKDLTTRMPLMSSRTERFMLSYLWNTRSKMGCVLKMTNTNTAANTGTSAKKINEMVTFTVNDMTSEKMSMNGQRMATRMIIMYAICTFITSVVWRVTNDEVEKRSMFAKE